jgi:conjugal transfer pilus assembly protein TraW
MTPNNTYQGFMLDAAHNVGRWVLLLGYVLVLEYFFGSHAFAQERVKVGPTYPIVEKDFLKAIEAKLKKKEASGDIEKWQREAIARSQQSIEQPKPIESVMRTDRARTYYFDPTITLSKDLATPEGQLISPAGTVVNPLTIVSLSKALLFFDAREKDQVSMAKKTIDRLQGKVKPILTGGSYMDLMRSWKKQVYYDQSGVLVTKLGIRQVPALVTQEGNKLRIDELEVRP